MLLLPLSLEVAVLADERIQEEGRTQETDDPDAPRTPLARQRHAAAATRAELAGRL